MIKELIKLATHLDAKGLRKEADYLDAVIKKTAADEDDFIFEGDHAAIQKGIEGRRGISHRAVAAYPGSFASSRNATLNLGELEGQIREMAPDFLASANSIAWWQEAVGKAILTASGAKADYSDPEEGPDIAAPSIIN